MRYVIGGLLLFGAGVGVGFLLAEGRDAPERVSTDRSAIAAGPVDGDAAGPRAAAPGAAAPQAEADGARIDRDASPSTAAPAPDAEAAKPEPPAFAAMIKQTLPLIRMSARQDAAREATQLAALLGLDEHRTRQLKELLQKRAVARIDEGLVPALENDELDVAKLEALGDGDEVTPEFERDLAGVLNAHEIDGVREFYAEKKEKRIVAQVEAEFEELALPDLTEAQSARVREILRADIEAPSVGAAPAGAVPDDLSADALSGWATKQHERRRELLRPVLTPRQLERLDERHREEVQEMKLAAGLFGAIGQGGISVGVAVKTPDEPDGDGE